MTSQPATNDEPLLAAVIGGGPGADAAALELMKRHDPDTLGQAVALVSTRGSVSDEVIDALEYAWSIYRHLREMPRD